MFVEVEGAPTFQVGFAFSEDKELPAETADYMRRFRGCIEQSCAPYLEKRPLRTGA